MAGVVKVGCLNVRGLNGEGKREEVGVLFEERGFDLLALSETKLKGDGEMMFGKYKGVISGVKEEVRAREGVAIIISDKWWKYVRKVKRVSTRVMWVRMQFGGES